MSELDERQLASDQPVGDKPKGTSNEDFTEFVRRRKNERSQIDRDEGRLPWQVTG